MNTKHSQGFTLIELAIVLFIMAILIGSFIGSLTSRIENNRIEETTEDLERIKQALIGYAYRNGHLPCPDCISVGSNCNPAGFRDGIEDRGVGGGTPIGSCSTKNNPGSLPWVTLGLGRGDAWGHRYYYWVHKTFSSDATSPGGLFNLSDPPTAPAVEDPVMAQIFDRTDDGAATVQVADNVIAVIYSSGKNGYGTYSVDNVSLPGIPAANIDELENRDNDAPNAADFAIPMVFVSRPPTSEDATTAGGEFDDIVIWLTDYELKAKMVEAGVLP